MKSLARLLNIALIVLLIYLFLTVSSALAQDEQPLNPQGLLEPFGPILAASTAIERLLQLVRNIISPDPEQGPMARGTKALRYYTTLGGTGLGMALVYFSDLRLLASAGIAFNGLIDTLLTGIVVGMGTEVVHELIKVLAEGKDALRANAQKDQAVG